MTFVLFMISGPNFGFESFVVMYKQKLSFQSTCFPTKKQIAQEENVSLRIANKPSSEFAQLRNETDSRG